MPYKVMISYSWKDSVVRAAFVAHLNRLEGVEVLFDRTAIEYGNPIHDRISDLLSEADVVLAILTPEGLKSKEVRDELSRAHERRKPIVPIVNKGTRLEALPAFLRDAKRLTYTPPDIDLLLEELVSYFKGLVAKSLLVPGRSEAKEQNTPQTGTEIEIKLESTTSLQFKFSVIEPPEIVLRKVRSLCEILEIQVGKQSGSEIVDEYFDDNVQSLGRNGCSFRRRDQDGVHLVTLKCHQGVALHKALKRAEEEFKCDDEEFLALVQSPKRVSREFRDRIGVELKCGALSKVLALRNKRTALALTTRENPYRFCYDRFYFMDAMELEYSEYNAEIEIELKGKEKYDSQLEKLRNGISSLLLYSPSPKSKFQRGVEWILGRVESSRHAFVVCFGILGFSLRLAGLQKQQIQILNHHVKEAMKEVRGSNSEESVIYLATGDGMALVFEEDPQDLVPIVGRVQDRLRRDLEKRRQEDGFAFRVGLHAGPVFKYSDVNESLSYAGSGVSVAHRLMSLGDAWHILASDAVLRALEGVGERAEFYDLGIFKTGDVDSIRVFNVHRDGVGSSGRPLSLST